MEEYFFDYEFMSNMTDTWDLCKRAPYDVTLEVGTTSFEAHRRILGQSCLFFNAMFNTGFKEEREQVVVIHEVTPEAMQLIIKYVYDAKVPVSITDVMAIIPAANYFALDTLKALACQHLVDLIDARNWLGVWQWADAYNIPFIQAAAREIAFTTFGQLLDEELPHLRYSMLADILSSPLLDVTSPDALGEKVDIWVKASPEEREVHREELMQMVKNVKRHPSEIPVLIVAGGELSTKKLTATAECAVIRHRGHFQLERWRTRVPHYCVRGQPLNTCPTKNNVISRIRCPRKSAVVTATKYHLYILGGQSSKTDLLSCEVYSIKNNIWSPLPELPVAMPRGAATVFENTLYVVSKNGFYCHVLGSGEGWKELRRPRKDKEHFSFTKSAPGFLVLTCYNLDDTYPHALRFDLVRKRWMDITGLKHVLPLWTSIMLEDDDMCQILFPKRDKKWDIGKDIWRKVTGMRPVPVHQVRFTTDGCRYTNYEETLVTWNDFTINIGAGWLVDTCSSDVFLIKPSSIQKCTITSLSSLKIPRMGAMAAVLYIPEYEQDPI